MRKIAARLVILLALAGVVAAGYYLVSHLPDAERAPATATVQRGDLTVRTYLRGELRAVRSTTLTAPNLGSVSQVTQLAAPGSLARPKDLIAEFDDSDRRVFLEDAQIDVSKIKEDLKKAETELEILKSQDRVELMSAEFAVRRAELDVKQNELLSAIDARKNELTLEESRRRQQKLDSDIESRLQQREAELAVLREELRKAELEVDREQRRIENARVLAPLGGLVSILDNRAGGRAGFGQSAPPVQEGDQVPPGLAIVQLLDLSEMDLVAKVEEAQRAGMHEGQEAEIYLDALPGKMVKGKVKRLGTTASMNFFRGEATKKFDCVISVDMRQLLENVGATPVQIDRILAIAKSNAQRGSQEARVPAATPIPPPQAGQAQAGQRGARSRGAGQGQGADQSAQGKSVQGKSADGKSAQAKSGRGGRGSGQDRERMRKMMQKMAGGRDIQSMSQEDRRQLFQQMRARMGGGRGGGGQRGGGQPEGGSPQGGAPGGGRGGEQRGGGRGASPGGVPDIASLSISRPGAKKFTVEEREKATLPSPPTQGSDVEVLLRPGLLADAQVVLERIPDALHIPLQGVFEEGGNSIVYISAAGRLQPRRVELGRRTETRVEVLDGLVEGETLSLEPPVDQRERDRAKKKKAAGKSGPSFPGGGGGGPGGGGSRGGGGRGGRSR